MRRALPGIVCGFFCTALLAAEDPAPAPALRTPVLVRHSGVDPVGLALAAAIREQLDGAPALFLATETADPRLILTVATVDGSIEDPEKQTAASINLLYDADELPLNGYLIAGLVQVCGITRTRDCAVEIVGTIDAALLKLRSGNPDFWQALQPAP